MRKWDPPPNKDATLNQQIKTFDSLLTLIKPPSHFTWSKNYWKSTDASIYGYIYIYIHINMCLRPNIKRSRVLELPNGIRTKCKKIYRQHKECSLLYIYINMYILESCFWHTLTVRSIQLGSTLPRSLTSLKVANLSQ